MINLDKLSGAVRARRGSRTLNDIADECSVPTSTLNRIENGTNAPDLSTFAKICDWLELPMDYFREPPEEAEVIA